MDENKAFNKCGIQTLGPVTINGHKCIYKSAKEQTIPFQFKPISGYAPCSYWRIGFEIGFKENSNMFNMALCHLLLCAAYSGHRMPYGTQWPPMQLSPFFWEL